MAGQTPEARSFVLALLFATRGLFPTVHVFSLPEAHSARLDKVCLASPRDPLSHRLAS